MQKKKWLSYLLCVTMLVTSFAGSTATASAKELDGYRDWIEFTKESAMQAPSGSFSTTGEAITLLDTSEESNFIPGFYLRRSDNEWKATTDGAIAYPIMEFDLMISDPSVATWVLQADYIGNGSFVDVIDDTTQTDGDPTALGFDTSADGSGLTVRIEAKPGNYQMVGYDVDGELVVESNEVYALMPDDNAPSIVSVTIDDQVKEGYQSKYYDFTGTTYEQTDVYLSSPIGVGAAMSGDILTSWYLLNPYNADRIDRGDTASYTTTNADAGYYLMCTVTYQPESGSEKCEYTTRVTDAPLVAPVIGEVGAIDNTGFTLLLNTPVVLTADDLHLEYDYVSEYETITVSAVEDYTNAHNAYRISADLADVPEGATFALWGSEKAETLFTLGEFPNQQPGADPNDPEGLTGLTDLATPSITFNDNDIDNVYMKGDSFSITLDMSEYTAPGSSYGLENGSVVRVALGELSEDGLTIYPFSSTAGGTTNPFSDLVLTGSHDATLDGNGHSYHYVEATIADDEVTIQGTLAQGIVPSAAGLVIVSRNGNAILSAVTPLINGTKMTIFGAENALPEEITATPALTEIDDFYNVDSISFGQAFIGTGLSGSIAFENLNLLQNYYDLIYLGESLCMRQVNDADPTDGFEMGLDDTNIVFLSENPATITIDGLDALETELDETFNVDTFSITGDELADNLAYSNGQFSFDVPHFSTYVVEMNLATNPGGGNVNNSAALTGEADLAAPKISIVDDDLDNIYFSGNAFEMSIDLTEMVDNPNANIDNGDWIRVAIGRTTGSTTTISPFVDKNGTPMSPFSGSFDALDYYTWEQPGDLDASYHYTEVLIVDKKVTVSGTLVAGLAPDYLGVVIVSGDGSAVLSSMAPLKDDKGDADDSNDQPVLFDVDTYKPGYLTYTPALNEIDNFYNVPSLTASADLGPQGMTGSIEFNDINLMESKYDLINLSNGVIMRPIDYSDPTAGFRMGLDNVYTSLDDNPATLTIATMGAINIAFDQTLTADNIYVSGDAINGVPVYNESTGVLTFDVFNFSTYDVTFDLSGGGDPGTVDGPEVSSLSLVYMDTYGNEKEVMVEALTHGAFDYEISLYDNVTASTWFSLNIGETDYNVIQNYSFNLSPTDDGLVGTGYITIESTIDQKTSTYAVEVFADARSITTEGFERTYFQGQMKDNTTADLYLSATDPCGYESAVSSLGAMRVFIDDEPLSSNDYSFDNSTGCLGIDSDTINQLTPDKYSVRVEVGTADDYVYTTAWLMVQDNEATITLHQPENGVLSVYPIDWSTGSASTGSAIQSGATVPTGDDHDISIVYNGGGVGRIIDASIAESYFGEGYDYDVTVDLITNPGGYHWQPWGNVTITATSAAIVADDLLPTLEAVNLYTYDVEDDEYVLQQPGSERIYVTNDLSVEFQFDKEEPYSYVDCTWQYMDENGDYTDETVMGTYDNMLFLWDFQDETSNNYVRLTVTPIDGYTKGTPIVREFLVRAKSEIRPAPTGIIGVAPTTIANDDGKLVGTSSSMEYRAYGEDEQAYQACEAPETTGLTPGYYLVRYRATDLIPAVDGEMTRPASRPVKVLVPEYQSDITTLTVSGLAVLDKEYDGTLAATLTGAAILTGVVPNDDVSLTGSAIAAFTNKNAGEDKVVIVSGLSLTGADAENYTLGAVQLTADITKKELTATAKDQTKDQGTANPKTQIIYDGFVDGENAANAGITAPTVTHTATTASLAGTYPINISGGSGGANYTLTLKSGTLTVNRTDIPLTGMSLAKESTTLLVGGTETLVVNYTPANASDKRITWSSSDATVASVDSNGKLTALKAGATTISAIAVDGGYNDTCAVTVNTPMTIVGALEYSNGTVIAKTAGTYVVNGANYPIYNANFADTNLPLTLTLTASGTEVEDAKNYTIAQSMNSGTATTITKTGTELKAGIEIVLARTAAMIDGTYTFTFVIQDGNTTKATVSIPIKIENTPILPTNLTIPTSTIRLGVAQTSTIYTIVTPYNTTNKSVNFTSSNPAVATVDASTGVVTGVGAGTATITAKTVARDLPATTATTTVIVGAKITGTLKQDGVALPNAYVYLYNGSDQLVGWSYTGANGDITFNGFGPGNYTAWAYTGNYLYEDASKAVTVSPGATTVDLGTLNFTSKYPEKATLTVQLEDEDTGGIPNLSQNSVYVNLYCYETGFSSYHEMTDAEKAAGLMTFTDLPYKAGGTSYDISISTGDYWTYTNLSVNADDVTQLFEIPVRYSISGSVKISSNGTQTKAPQYTLVVAISDATGSWYYAYVDGTGNYKFSGMPAGSYEVKPYDNSKYDVTPIDVTISAASGSVTGQNLVMTKGADLTGHVRKAGVDAYKAYVTLSKKDGNGAYQYVSGTTAGSSGFLMEGVLKTAGDYQLDIYYVSEKNGTYPAIVDTPLEFTVSGTDVTSGRYTASDLTYAYPTNAAEVFQGNGNSVLATKSVVRNGSELSLVIKYKNNGNQEIDAAFEVTLPAGVSTTEALTFTATDLAAGATGQHSIPLTVTNPSGTYLSIPVKVTINGEATKYDFGSATLEVAGVTLQGPGAAKLNESFKVFGEATAGSMVAIKNAITGTTLATVKTSGRFYSTQITLAAEGVTTLVAQITDATGAVTATSQTLEIDVDADQVLISKVKNVGTGELDIPINATLGVRTLLAWVDYYLNGRDFSIGTLFDPNALVSSVVYHFSGNDYTATKGADGYFTAIFNNWSGSGLKTITATVTTTDGRTLNYLIAEVTILIDPSGYVTDEETGDPVDGATVVCEKKVGGAWVKWTTDPAQNNPQLTDETGHYGWDVENGTYRVVATKDGYEPYATTDDADPNISTIDIPPVRTDIDFELTPSVAMASIIINHDTLDITAGNTAQLSATANPADATNKDKITWESSDESIATVNAAGVVTAKAAGTVTISAVFDRATAADLTATCTVTVTGTTGGGTGGGGGSLGVKDPTAPTTGTQGDKTVITAKLDGTTANGKTTVAVTAETVTSLLDSAKKAETEGKGAIVEFRGTAPADSARVAFEIPKDSFKKIAEETKASVTVDTDLASITFDEAAVDAVNGAGSGDISINIAKVDATSLSAEAKALVGDRPVYDFSVKAGDKTVSSFNGNVTVSVPYTLKSNEDPQAIVIYYVNSNGALETMRGKYNSETGNVEFVTDHFSKYAVGYNKISFTDVSETAWYNDAVTFMAARGITSGTSEGIFSPNANLTRGQFISMLLRAYGIEATTTADNFKDAGNTYYTGYLAAAKQLGITEGTGDGYYLPDQQITRQDMFVLLYRTLSVLGEIPAAETTKTVGSFTDAAKVSSYATDAMNALIAAGIVTGSNHAIDPIGTSTRAQMAQVLYNLLSK